MKKVICLSLLWLYFVASSDAQNIIPNPSFEIYSVCPSAGSPISDVAGWNSFKETPDYLNSCASTASCVSVPATCAGYQQAASGNGIVALFAYGQQGADTIFREYIGSPLSAILTIGQKYYVSMRVNLPRSTYCATNNIGILFSTVPYSYSNPTPIQNFAHVYSSSIITDTANWVTISGSFVADSLYHYVIIGNFFDNQHTQHDMLDSQISICASYYFVDDICVSTDSMTCMGSTGINEQHQQLPQLSVFPNPSTSTFTIQLPTQQSYTLSVIDITGRNVYENKNATNTITIDASGFSPGVYFVKAVNQRTVLTEKLVKEY